MQDLMILNNELTMSSKEIAELVESRHDNVRRTMDTLRDKGLISVTQTEEPLANGGKPLTVYHVNKRDSYVVVAQLSPEFTARLVDRWQELEEQQSTQFKVPQTFQEALQLAADIEKEKLVIAQQRDTAIKTKAEIGSRREATAMATASKEKRRADKLADELGFGQNYIQAKGIEGLDEFFDTKKPGFWSQCGKVLSAITRKLGIEPKTIPDPQWGAVKVYPKKAELQFKNQAQNDTEFMTRYRKATTH